jgi:Ribbon-helix-helix protein, copG family
VAKRPSLRDRLDQEPEGRGREAVFGPRSAVDEQRHTVDRGPSTVDLDRWEDTHQRVTFYCPRDLLAAVEAEMRRSGRSKSRVIVEAIAEHLGRGLSS